MAPASWYQGSFLKVMVTSKDHLLFIGTKDSYSLCLTHGMASGAMDLLSME